MVKANPTLELANKWLDHKQRCRKLTVDVFLSHNVSTFTCEFRAGLDGDREEEKNSGTN